MALRQDAEIDGASVSELTRVGVDWIPARPDPDEPL